MPISSSFWVFMHYGSIKISLQTHRCSTALSPYQIVPDWVIWIISPVIIITEWTTLKLCYVKVTGAMILLQNITMLWMFNATFNNISAILQWSVYNGGGNRNNRKKPLTCLSQATDKSYCIKLCWVDLARSGIQTLVVIGTDCIGRCKIQLPYDHDGIFKISMYLSYPGKIHSWKLL